MTSGDSFISLNINFVKHMIFLYLQDMICLEFAILLTFLISCTISLSSTVSKCLSYQACWAVVFYVEDIFLCWLWNQPVVCIYLRDVNICHDSLDACTIGRYLSDWERSCVWIRCNDILQRKHRSGNRYGRNLSVSCNVCCIVRLTYM